MSRITLAPNASGTGTLTVAAPNTNTDRTLTLPDVTTTLVGTDATQTLTNKTLTAPIISGNLGAGGATYGTSGQVLTSGGAGANTSWTTITGVPAGAIVYFAMNTPPSGWVKADGTAVSRTTYATLFAAIGTTFGVGDGSTTFNLPDIRGEFMRGWDDGRGVDSGRAFGSAQSSQNLAHTHTVNNYTSGSSGSTGGGGAGSTTFASTSTTSSSGGTEARPRNIALLACIKY